VDEIEPRRSRARLWLAALLLVVYGIFVLFVVYWPTPVDKGLESSIDKVLSVLHRHGVPGWFGYHKLEFSANIAMFVPLGFLIALVLPAKRWWLTLIIGPVASALIEVSQGLFLSERFASVLDVVANSTGAIIGAIIAVILRALVYQRDQAVVARALWESRNSAPRR
jgi:glycopeptide antibiotics resistance protein